MNRIPTRPREPSTLAGAALGTFRFPLTKAEAIARVGDRTIPYSPDIRVPLADLVRGLPARTLQDSAAATAALDRRWAGIARSLAAVEAAEKWESAHEPRR